MDEIKEQKTAENGQDNAPESQEEQVEQAVEKIAVPHAEQKKQEPEPAVSQGKPADSATGTKGFQPRKTEFQTPTECTSCGKALKKKLWYYRNNAYYCTKRCYSRKVGEDKKKAEGDAA